MHIYNIHFDNVVVRYKLVQSLSFKMTEPSPTFCNPSILLELGKLRQDILSTSSQDAVKMLFSRCSDRIKDIFSNLSSSDSEISSNRGIFILCFDCLSLFMKHRVSHPSYLEKDTYVEVILDGVSIYIIMESFLSQMIRVESVLRNETLAKAPKELRSETEATRLNSITIALFRMLNISTCKVRVLRNTILPQISKLLANIFAFGLSKKLEETFVEDILMTCRTIAFAKDNLTKDSLLSILLPHILPWMKKYPDKKFFLHWSNILKNLTLDENNSKPHGDRCSQLWFVFHPVLDVIKDSASKGITFDDEAVIPCLCFFANLSDSPFRAFEVYDSIKDGLIDSWFEMVKMTKKEDDPHRLATRYWTNLISTLSNVSSIVPSLKCRYDEMMWCSENGGQAASHSRYIDNCFPLMKKWCDLGNKIQTCDSVSKSRLYYQYSGELFSVFYACQSKREIKDNMPVILICLKLLDLFIQHFPVSGDTVILPFRDIENIIDTFIDSITRVQESLEGFADEVYFGICLRYTHLALLENSHTMDSFLTRVTPSFKRFLEEGSEEEMDDKTSLRVFVTLSNHCISPNFKPRFQILSLIKPYVRGWLRVCDNVSVYAQIILIISLCTTSSDIESFGIVSPEKSLTSEAWPLFYPILDVVKVKSVWDKIVDGNRNCFVHFFVFFANLCCNPSHALEVYENTKDFLDVWFDTVKTDNNRMGIEFWARLISIFSSFPSIVSGLSPKYNTKMEWCFENGAKSEDYYQFIDNIAFRSLDIVDPFKKWVKLVGDIKKCRDPGSTSTLYHKYRDEIFSRFISLHSKSEIEEHKQEITLCAQCLNLFVRHIVSGKDIELPLYDLNHLVDTFLDHLARVEEVLKEAVDGEYCCISVIYSFKMRQTRDSFLLKILPTFKRIFERGSKDELGFINDLKFSTALDLLRTIRNISNSTCTSTKSHIFNLIKPNIKDWLEMYRSSEFYGHWMCILSHITLDKGNPNKSLCSEAWPLFHTVLDVVKREFVGDKIVQDAHNNNHDIDFLLFFFSNLCCDPSHALQIFDNIKDLLEGCFEAMKSKRAGYGIPFWCRLISMLSTVPSIVPQICPKYVEAMKWCNENGRIEDLLRLKLIEADDTFLDLIVKVGPKDVTEKEIDEEEKGEKEGEKEYCTIFDHDYQRYVDNCKYKEEEETEQW
ncbi:hypothetical protein ADUPG1_013180 [Aduncisulcus paluster]|uniref:Uncharacterized protein n=1 Tax=Aduncisulcus paluster TaxID=2918883 RepID=A0ABQ5K232_9EUKA|nr:hypothetical protein ADUPG1_013180 [Aduncisulcus paluster]